MNYSNELEQVAISLMIHHPRLASEIKGALPIESYYDEQHKKIASECYLLEAESKAIDSNILASRLVDDQIASEKLMECLITEANPENTGDYCLELKSLWLKREVIKELSELQVKFSINHDLDGVDMVADLSKSYEKLAQISQGKPISDTMDLYDRGMKALKDEFYGVKTGIPTLDAEFGGFERQNLWIIAARPGMGKTVMALNVMSYNTLQGLNTKFFSFEMSDVDLIHRVWADIADIDYQYIKDRNLSENQFDHLATEALELVRDNLEVIDSGIFSVDQLVSYCKTEHNKKPIDLIIVDYLQLIPDSNGNKGSTNDKVAEKSRKLKLLAMHCKCPIICLSQLNRGVENRPDKRPVNSDLRDSGAIEQDADGIIFLYRDEYYGIEQDADGYPTAGRAEIIFSKYRNGTTGTTRVDANFSKMRFQ